MSHVVWKISVLRMARYRPKVGPFITYLPIIQRRKIEPASPIAVIRVRLSDLGHGDIFSSKLLSTYQVLCRGLCDIHTESTSNENTPSV